MKKTIITLAILLITSFGFSQGFHIGAKAGANFANQKGGDNDENFKTRTAFHAGLIGELGLSEKFSVQGELLYNSLGTKGEEIQSGNGYTLAVKGDIKTDYLSLPILAKYYIIKGLSAEAGPQFSYLLSSNYDATASDNFGNSESLSVDIKDDTKKMDIGFAVGASYKLDFGLYFGLRYVLGLSKIYEDEVILQDDSEGFSAVYDIERKNKVFQASIGYFFN